MNLRSFATKDKLIKNKRNELCCLRTSKRMELLNRNRIIEEEIEIDELKEIKKENIKELMKEMNGYEEKIYEKLLFTKHQIKEIPNQLNENEINELIKVLINLINCKENKISILSIDLLNQLIQISILYVKYIEENEGIETIYKNMNEKELFIPMIKLIGNMINQKSEKAKLIIHEMIKKSFEINEIITYRFIACLINNCSTVQYNVTEYIIPLLKLNDEEITTELLLSCISFTSHNIEIPINEIIMFLNDEKYREYIIEIIGCYTIYKKYLNDIFQLLPRFYLTKLEPDEITNIIWIIGNMIETIENVYDLYRIGSVEYIIEKSKSLEISIKRQSCQTLNIIIETSKNDLNMINNLVNLKIEETLMDLFSSQEKLQNDDIISILESIKILLEIDSNVNLNILERIEEQSYLFNTLLFNSKTPTKIVKRLQYIVNTFFD